MNNPKLERCHIGPWDEVLLDEHGRKCVAILKRQIAELEKENAALRRAPLPDNKALTVELDAAITQLCEYCRALNDRMDKTPNCESVFF